MAEENVYEDLIYLAGCAINETAPSLKRAGTMDLEKIHALASSLSIESLIFFAVEKIPDISTGSDTLKGSGLYKTWKDEYDQSVFRSIMFDRAWDKFRAYLEDNGIWYLLLKGMAIKDLYPETGMRNMCDVDVLIDAEYEKKAKDYFTDHGFETEIYETGNHDCYLKKPFYNFEVHTSLFAYPHPEEWITYYQNVKERLILNTGSDYGYHFSDDDLYVYLITHGYKHYKSGGKGISFLLDIFVYLKSKGDRLDFGYIGKECEKLGISEFEGSSRLISRELFASPETFAYDNLTEKEQKFVKEFLSFGTYGTIKNMVHNKLKELDPADETPSLRTKVRYVWKRIFPDAEVFKMYYPFFYRHKFLMPFGYIYRLIYKGITNRSQAAEELKAVRQG